MKTFCSATLIVLFLLLISNGMQAQTTLTQLNQVELMKKWIGTWMSEDKLTIAEIKAYGTGGLQGYQKTIFRDSVRSEHRFVYGYDKKSDKYVCAGITRDNPEISLLVFWFTSENICERIPYEYISNPEEATSKAIYEFKTPDSMIATFREKDQPDRIFNLFRGKK